MKFKIFSRSTNVLTVYPFPYDVHYIFQSQYCVRSVEAPWL